MVIHYIILSSSYSTKCRIAYDMTFEGNVDSDRTASAKEKVLGAYGGPYVPMGTHVLTTESADWQSVVDHDPYFEGVRLIDDIDEFVELVKRDMMFKGVDVADYILSQFRCTHSKLEKLVYLCYTDYMSETGRELFEDRIVRTDSGPVVESVFRKYGSGDTDEGEDLLEAPSRSTMAIRSRLLFAVHGDEKTYGIDATLERYAGSPEEELEGLVSGN